MKEGNFAHGGSGAGYASYGCRCDECVKAHRERVARRRAQRKNEPIPESVVHGTASTYTNWCCRCDLCKEAQRVKMANYWRQRREDEALEAATGSGGQP